MSSARSPGIQGIGPGSPPGRGPGNGGGMGIVGCGKALCSSKVFPFRAIAVRAG